MGYKLAVTIQEAKQAEYYEDLLAVIKKNDDLSRSVIQEYQSK